jgi:iron complex transport system substrate-binding protein
MLKFKNKGALLLAFAIGISVSGCGSKPAKTAVEESAEIRVISTEQGEIEIPADPKRVIVTYCVGDALALGITPVAAYDAAGTAYAKELEEVPVLGNFEAEQLISYEPDLLIVANQEQYEIASKIAPTILLPFTAQSMDERVRFMGDVLNRQEKANAVLNTFHEKLEVAKASLREKNVLDKTFSVIESDGDGGIWVYGDKWGRGGDLLYSQLELQAPEIVEKEIIAAEQYRDVSMEVISDYIGDYIVIARGLEELEGNTIWESLPAVKAGNVIPIEFTLFYDIDIYSSNVQLDYLLNALLKTQE